ncbi:fibronectin type III domain-containing protein [Cryptosporidium andersoni]|uniref:Fibronectin type III domain-containing protein n=1 Tax=Cryptosporidium andersoni TaxID=117008 RepID=A0A1J4MQH2_9CRYT|nr:fibronectin type III domain-containing protein [Cryptosporidium andersoni]
MFLVYHLAWIIFILPIYSIYCWDIYSLYDDIHIEIFYGSEVQIKELFKLTNSNFLPVLVNAHFKWKKFSKYYDNVHEFAHFKFGNSKFHEYDNIYNIFDNKQITKTVIDNRNQNLFLFYDYEFNPNRPLDTNEEDIWRTVEYNSIFIENIIIPGKGSGRLFAAIEGSRAYRCGLYEGIIEITDGDKMVIKKVSVLVKYPPIIVFDGMNNKDDILPLSNRLIASTASVKIRNYCINSILYVDILVKRSAHLKCIICSQKAILPGYDLLVEFKCSEQPSNQLELIEYLIELKANWKDGNYFTKFIFKSLDGDIMKRGLLEIRNHNPIFEWKPPIIIDEGIYPACMTCLRKNYTQGLNTQIYSVIYSDELGISIYLEVENTLQQLSKVSLRTWSTYKSLLRFHDDSTVDIFECEFSYITNISENQRFCEIYDNEGGIKVLLNSVEIHLDEKISGEIFYYSINKLGNQIELYKKYPSGDYVTIVKVEIKNILETIVIQVFSKSVVDFWFADKTQLRRDMVGDTMELYGIIIEKKTLQDKIIRSLLSKRTFPTDEFFIGEIESVKLGKENIIFDFETLSRFGSVEIFDLDMKLTLGKLMGKLNNGDNIEPNIIGSLVSASFHAGKRNLVIKMEAMTYKNSLLIFRVYLNSTEELFNDLMMYSNIRESILVNPFIWLIIPVNIIASFKTANTNSGKYNITQTILLKVIIRFPSIFVYKGYLYNNILFINIENDYLNLQHVKIMKYEQVIGGKTEIEVAIYRHNSDNLLMNYTQITKPYGLYDVRLELSIFPKSVIESALKKSYNQGILVEIPYFLKIGEKRFQIGILGRCGLVKVSKLEVNFDIIPVGINKYKKYVTLQLESQDNLCNEEVVVCFEISRYYKLNIVGEEVLETLNSSDTGLYLQFYKLSPKTIYSVYIEVNIKDIKLGSKELLNISHTLNIYSNAAYSMMNEMQSESIKFIRFSDHKNLPEKFKEPLFLAQFVTLTGQIRSLDVKIQNPKVQNNYSRYTSYSKNETMSLPVGLNIIEIINQENFLVQYSILMSDQSTKYDLKDKIDSLERFITKNYAIYTSHNKSKSIIVEAPLSITDRILCSLRNEKSYYIYENLIFNFPLGEKLYSNIEFDWLKGTLKLKDNLKTNKLNIHLMEPFDKVCKISKVESIYIEMGHISTTKWLIRLNFSSIYEVQLLLFESGRIDWIWKNYISSVSEDILKVFSISTDRSDVLDFISELEIDRNLKYFSISIVPWLEVSSDIPRDGYLMPNEKRTVPIWVHNQIIMTSSYRSQQKSLHGTTLIKFRGITASKDIHSIFLKRILKENSDNFNFDGASSVLNLDWSVPNIIYGKNQGTGYVKYIALMNSTTPILYFILEIQKPTLCTGSSSSGNYKICQPYSNDDVVKGFRVIWYPQNKFNPTNYRSTEFLINDIPKLDLRNDVFDGEAHFSNLFIEYKNKYKREKSGFAYILAIECDCLPSKHYTFKFAITHNYNIPNSVYIPPFGFNVTVSDLPLRVLKSKYNRTDNLEELCKGLITLNSDNTGIFKWKRNREINGSIRNIVLGYKIADIKTDTIENTLDWTFSDSYNAQEMLINFSNPNSDEVINEYVESEFTIKPLPANTNIQFIFKMENNNTDEIICNSKIYSTNKGVPTKPTNVLYSPLTYNSVSISWSNPLNNGGYKLIGFSYNIYPSKNLTTDKISNMTKNSFLIIDNMIPMVPYTVEVYSINELGKSEASLIENVFTKPIDCSQFSDSIIDLVISQNTGIEITWALNQASSFKNIDNNSMIFIYCKQSGEDILLEISYIKDLCHLNICKWTENKVNKVRKCVFYYIKVLNQDYKEFNCQIYSDSGITSEFRRLNSITSRQNSIYFIDLKKDSENSNVYYPKGYSTTWSNGLSRAVLKLGISSNIVLVHISIKYLYRIGIFNITILNGTSDQIWYNEYEYNVKSYDNKILSKHNIEYELFDNWHLNRINDDNSIEREIELMLINLVPGEVLLSIQGIDKFQNITDELNHIIKLPNYSYSKNYLRNLVETNILEVQIHTGKALIDSALSNHRQLLVENLENTTFELSTPSQISKYRHYTPNYLFVTSKLVVSEWPDDYERHLFKNITVKAYSGQYNFGDHGEKLLEQQIIYIPVLELKPFMLQNQIFINMFDGKAETEFKFYKTFNQSLSDNLRADRQSSYFPHISLLFDPPSCVMYIKIKWSANYAPLSTKVSTYLKTKSSRKYVQRQFNESPHSCSQVKNPIDNNSSLYNYTKEDRIDILQIFPPEEMVNTYMVDPSRRYPLMKNITLLFIGSCNLDQNQSESIAPVLSIIEMDIIPCQTHDLMLSYSDPLSSKNTTLINYKHKIDKLLLEKKYRQIQDIIVNNIKSHIFNDKLVGDGYTDLLLAKYNSSLYENEVYIDFQTIFSEEFALRSLEFSPLRVLLYTNDWKKLKERSLLSNQVSLYKITINQTNNSIELLKSFKFVIRWIFLSYILYKLYFILKKIVIY